MMGVIAKDPTQKAGLAELATDAQASLKRGDLDAAAAGMDILRDALGGGAGGGGGGGGGGAGGTSAGGSAPGGDVKDGGGAGDTAGAGSVDVPKLLKSVAAWTATRGRIDAELQKLTKAIMAAGEGEPMAGDIEEQVAAVVDPLLLSLDGDLTETLSQAAATEDAGERQKLIQQARQTIGEYIQLVYGNGTINALDANPFVPLSIGKTLSTTLNALSATLR